MTTYPGAKLSLAKPERSFRELVSDRRGATMVEYAILLFLVLVVASAVYKTVGKKTRQAGDMTTAQFQ